MRLEETGAPTSQAAPKQNRGSEVMVTFTLCCLVAFVSSEGEALMNLSIVRIGHSYSFFKAFSGAVGLYKPQDRNCWTQAGK